MILKINDGCILLYEGVKTIVLSLKDVYSVVYGKTTSLHGHEITREAFQTLGLNFHRYAATPLIALESAKTKSGGEITCKPKYRHTSNTELIEAVACVNHDYLIHGKDWIPLPQGTAEALNEFLVIQNMDNFGGINLKQYLHIIQRPSDLFDVEDLTAVSLKAETISRQLTGDPPNSLKATLYPYQKAG